MAVKFEFQALEQLFEADWPVTVNVPQDGGSVEEQTFMARFRQVSDAELPEIAAADKDGKELYRRFFVGMGAGETEPWSEDLRERMLGRTHVRMGLYRAFQSFQNGVAVKNS